MKSNTRKMKPEDFKLFANGKFNTDFPLEYNLILGYSTRDYPKQDRRTLNLKDH